jgi:hypothetical protein
MKPPLLPSPGSSPLFLVFFVLGMFGAIWNSIKSVRQEHAGHVHTIWYIFSLAFCITLIFYSSLPTFSYNDAELSVSDSEDVITQLGRNFIDISTDLYGEIYLIGGLIIIVVIPQIMSFVISGIFGCASRPVFVERITNIATLSFIKFLSVFAGIEAATALFFFVHRSPVAPLPVVYTTAIAALLLMMSSFGILSMYYSSEKLYRAVVKHLVWLNPVVRYMSYYRTNTESAGKLRHISHEIGRSRTPPQP